MYSILHIKCDPNNSKAKSLPSAVINIMMDDAHGAELSAHDVQRSGDRRHDTHGEYCRSLSVSLCVQDKMSTSEVPTKLTPKSPPNTLSFAGTLTSAKFSFERKLGKFFCTDVFGVGPWKNM